MKKEKIFKRISNIKIYDFFILLKKLIVNLTKLTVIYY